jgi:hypothetical protein
MPRRLPRHNTGRPGILTRERHKDIVGLVEAGNHMYTAAAAAGIGPSTLYQWLHLGREATAAVAKGEPLTAQARAYAEFADAVVRARAIADARAVAVIERVMAGGSLISEEETVHPDGAVTTKRTYTPPDGRLALETVGRRSPDLWGRNGVTRVEMTGADGGPIEVVEERTVAAALAERFTQVLEERERERQEREERRALEAGGDDGGDVMDGEVVDD